MPKKRLSREESRELTRRRLLEAAARIIPKKGFLAASVEDIAEEAGFSRGAFYSNFSSKDELFITLLRELAESKYETVRAIFAAGDGPETLREKLRHFYARVCREHGEFILWTEAKVHAVRDPGFRSRLNALERETYEQVTANVARYCAQAGCPPAAPPEQLALGFMALTDGMAFAQLLHPERADQQTAEAVLTTFFDAVTRPV